MNLAKTQQARFDTRLTKSQKEFFELAIHSTQKVANKVIAQHNAILSTEEDRKIFFDALINPQKPNKSLKEAAKFYQKQVA
jgi:uncharacterized protein (DUF1778 family)